MWRDVEREKAYHLPRLLLQKKTHRVKSIFFLVNKWNSIAYHYTQRREALPAHFKGIYPFLDIFFKGVKSLEIEGVGRGNFPSLSYFLQISKKVLHMTPQAQNSLAKYFVRPWFKNSLAKYSVRPWSKPPSKILCTPLISKPPSKILCAPLIKTPSQNTPLISFFLFKPTTKNHFSIFYACSAALAD